MDDLVKKLSDGSYTVDDITDEDIRQLIIYYATIVRSYKMHTNTPLVSSSHAAQAILKGWRAMPPELWVRFSNMVLSNADNSAKDGFWIRAAETNIKFGVKIYVDHVDNP